MDTALKTPIVLFCYNRPEHLRRTLGALQANALADRSPLFVYCDGPKSGSDLGAVEKVREIARKIRGFASVEVLEQAKNQGLAQSIIGGVTDVLKTNTRVIVLEDDLETGRGFLRFMNEALDFYENENRVISIHGYTYPIARTLPETFFIRGADCWGWATWRRGWQLFNPNGQELLEKLTAKDELRAFDFDESYPYTEMLKNQIAGKNQSWAIRWYASAFLENKLTLYPGKSLVRNIGFDDSGTHSSRESQFNHGVFDGEIHVEKIEIEECAMARQEFGKFLRTLKPGLWRKIASKVHRTIRKGFDRSP